MSEENTKLKKFLEKKNIAKILEKMTKKYKGKRVLGYGTGQLANLILENHDISGLDLMGFADSKYMYEKEDFKGYKTYSPQEIKDLNPDAIMLFVIQPKEIIEYFDFYFSELGDIKKIKLVERTFWDKLIGN